MEDRRIASRYAKALYNEASSNDVVQSVEGDLNAISSLIHGGGPFKDFLFTPHLAREEKIKIAEKVLSDRITALTMQFVRLVLHKGRGEDLDAIRDEFAALRRAHGNVIYAEVISAEPLDDKDRQTLEQRLAEKTGKKIEAAYDVDPSLIGGVKVAYGNYVLDGTVRGSLRRLEDSLKHDVLKQF